MNGQTRLFVSQELLDRWVSEGRAAVDENVLRLLPDSMQLQIEPAVHILRVVSEQVDQHGLCGRVKTAVEIEALHGEQYMTSLLVHEAAYDVQPGYVGVPLAHDRASLDRLRALLLSMQ